MYKVCETSGWWTSLSTSHDERIMTAIAKQSKSKVQRNGKRNAKFCELGVRQSCPASGFFFAMTFDSKSQLSQRTPDNLEFLQPSQCAYADDLAVASSSFRGLMSALAPAFRSVDSIDGLNLNYRKCCWVQYGTEERDSCKHGFLRIAKSSVRCKLFDTPKMLEP